MKVMKILRLKWGNLDSRCKAEILSGACVNMRFVYAEWDDLESWLQQAIQDSIRQRSHNTVGLVA